MERTEPSKAQLLGTFAALLVLLALAVLAYLLPFSDPVKTVLALVISAAKMLLIFLFFMRVRFAQGMVLIYVGGGFFWLLILFLLTFADYVTR